MVGYTGRGAILSLSLYLRFFVFSILYYFRAGGVQIKSSRFRGPGQGFSQNLTIDFFRFSSGFDPPVGFCRA